MGHDCYWVRSTPVEKRPPLTADTKADVAVLGAGIVGLTVAYELAHTGRKVVVIDMHGIGHGTTGHTTGKLTVGHGLVYSRLARTHDVRTAQAYGELNNVGLKWIRRIVDKEGIDCDFEQKANYVYCEDEQGLEAMLEEVEAAKNAGIKARLVRDLDLPFAAPAAAMIGDQAQFHARKYLLQLANRIEAAGGVIHEGTRATAIDTRHGCRIETDGGGIDADFAVMATHYPFTERGLYFARVRPSRSYVVMGEVDPARAPDGMFINSGSPKRSVRTVPDGDRTLLMVAGNEHYVGEDFDTEDNYAGLADWMRRHFGVSEVAYRWSAQDGETVDGIPYAGTAWRSNNAVFMATGFAKWGLTNGTAAALLISRAITGYKGENAWLVDPHRLALESSARRFTKDNVNVGYHFIHDRFRHPQEGSSKELAPGEACVEGHGRRQVAAYRDEDGRLHRRSAHCTHLGCVVTWNNAEKSWDCPCHGSRFRFDGKVLEGPATFDLPHVDEEG